MSKLVCNPQMVAAGTSRLGRVNGPNNGPLVYPGAKTFSPQSIMTLNFLS